MMRQTSMILMAGWMLAGCSDPLAKFPTPADVDLAPTEPAAAIVEAPSERKPGLFGRLLGNAPAPEPTPVAADTEDVAQEIIAEVTGGAPAEAERPETPVVATASAPAAAPPEAASETAPVAPTVAEPAPVQPRRAGFFGLFSRRNAQAAPEPSAPAAPQAAAAAPARSTGPDTATVAPGEPVPFGEIATACAMRRGNLGRKIDTQAGFTLYDSAPGSIKARPHYITGFRDGCPRQFTAALALMGDPQGYEMAQQARAIKGRTPVDTAFDALRARVCGVRPGAPCGRKINRLARNTRLITAYATVAPSSRWADILLHSRKVSAMGVRTP